MSNAAGQSPVITGRDRLVGDILRRLQGLDADPRKQALDAAREKCRRGNPFPLIAMQWPFLLVPQDDPDHEIFVRDARDESLFAGIPDYLQDVVLDRNNPILRIDFWQKIILAGFFSPIIAEVYIKGCTGAGKGASSSIGLNLWYDVWEESRTTLSSESYEHAVTNIFGEVKMWRSKMTSPWPATVLAASLSDNDMRHYITVRNPKPTSGEAFSGMHGANTMFCFDESSAVSDLFVENAQKNARKIVALSNPRTMAGWFRAGFDGLQDKNKTAVTYGVLGPRLCVTVSGMHCANVRHGRLKRPVAPRDGIAIGAKRYDRGQPIPDEDHRLVAAIIKDQMDITQYQSILANPDSRHVAIFAHGFFPDEDPELQCILSSWLERHEAYWAAHHGEIDVTCFSVDVARSWHGDSTVVSCGGSRGVKDLEDWKVPDVTEHVNRVMAFARKHGVDLQKGQHPVVIDYGGGYGAGVGDPLRNMGVWVVEYIGSSSSEIRPRVFGNLRAETYATLGGRLDPQNQFKDEPWGIPPLPRLREELPAPLKTYAKDGIRFLLQSKDEVKKTLRGRSPDFGDTVAMLWHGVMLFHNLAQYFRQYEEPLVAYPASPRDGRAPDDPAAWAIHRHEQVEGGDSVGDLLEWIRGRYGRGERAVGDD